MINVAFCFSELLAEVAQHYLLQNAIHLPLLLLPHQFLYLQDCTGIISGSLPQGQTLLVYGPDQRVKKSHELSIDLNLLFLIKFLAPNKEQRMVNEIPDNFDLQPGQKREIIPQHQSNKQLIHDSFIASPDILLTALNNSHQSTQHLLIQLKLTQTTILKKKLIRSIFPHKEPLLILQDKPHDLRIKKHINSLHQVCMISPQQHVQR